MDKLSIRTQERILKNYSQHNNVSSPKASRKGYKNPNSKITEGFQDELLKSVEKYPSLGDRERSYYLSNKLNQKITPRMVSYWRSKGRITRKIAKVLFTERYTKEHLQQKHDFLKTMHPYTGKQTFLESMSTDESGFYLNATRKYAYSKVSYVRGKIFRNKKLAGSSYTNESSRAYIMMPKRKMGKINLMLSISLNPDFPVVDYSIKKEYWNKNMFTTYINNRSVPYDQNYDLIDRASFHNTKKEESGGKEMTLMDAYENNGTLPTYIPTGYPEMNPVEQAFNYLKQYVHTQAIKLQLKDGWKENQLKLAIEEGIKTITHERVKSWY